MKSSGTHELKVRAIAHREDPALARVVEITRRSEGCYSIAAARFFRTPKPGSESTPADSCGRLSNRRAGMICRRIAHVNDSGKAREEVTDEPS